MNTLSKDYHFISPTPFQASAPKAPKPWQFPSPDKNLSPSGAGIVSSDRSPPHNRALGYFAFPPASDTSVPSSDAIPEQRRRDEEQELRRRKEETDREANWGARLRRDAEIRQQRLEREKAEAVRGEEEWVRSGGILRDANGKRDMARTRAVKEELKLREVEKELTRRWAEYEKRWKELLASRKEEERSKVRFSDLPWPVDIDGVEEIELDDLTVEKVEGFLLGSLQVRGCTVTKKDRVRSSLLRWHPDKMTGVLARVVEEDLDLVKQGISVVMVCLQKLNSSI